MSTHVLHGPSPRRHHAHESTETAGPEAGASPRDPVGVGSRVRRDRAAGVLVAALVAVLGAGLGLLVGASPAAAHSALISSDPADGSTVAVAPAQLTLTFNEPAIALGTVVEVRGPGDATVSAGEPVLVDTAVTQALTGDLPAGTYTARWRVTSADGHPIEGELTFTAEGATTLAAPGAVAPTEPVDPAATPEPTAATPTEPTGPAEPTEPSAPSPTAATTPGAGSDPHAGHGGRAADGTSTGGVLAASVAAVAALAVAAAVLLRRRRPGPLLTDGAADGDRRPGSDGTAGGTGPDDDGVSDADLR